MCHFLHISHSPPLSCTIQIYTPSIQMNISKLNSKFHQYFPSVRVHSQIQLSFLCLKNYLVKTGCFCVSASVILNPPKITLGRTKQTGENRCFFHIALFESWEISFDSGLLDATRSHWNITDWI